MTFICIQRIEGLKLGKYLAIYDDELYDLCSEGAKEKNTTKSKYAKAVLREALAIKNSKDGTKNEVSNEASCLSESDRILLEEIKSLQEKLLRQCSGTTSNLNQVAKSLNTMAKNNNMRLKSDEFKAFFKNALNPVVNVKETYNSVGKQLDECFKKLDQ